MISSLIGMVTGMIYGCVGITGRLKAEDEARRLKARWALALGVWNTGGADEYTSTSWTGFSRKTKRSWTRSNETCRTNRLRFWSSAREHGSPGFGLLWSG